MQYGILISFVVMIILDLVFLWICNNAVSMLLFNLSMFLILVYPARLAFIYCKKRKTFKKFIPWLRNRETKRLNNLNIEQMAKYYKEEKTDKELSDALKGRPSYKILSSINSKALLAFLIIDILFGGILLFGILFYHLSFDSFRFTAYLLILLLPLSVLCSLQLCADIEYESGDKDIEGRETSTK